MVFPKTNKTCAQCNQNIGAECPFFGNGNSPVFRRLTFSEVFSGGPRNFRAQFAILLVAEERFSIGKKATSQTHAINAGTLNSN